MKRQSDVGLRQDRKSKLWIQLRNNRTLMLMCLPAVVFYIVFNYIPMPGAYIAFTNFKYNLGIFSSPFVGLDNFKFLWSSGKLWQLTRNTVLYNLAFIIIGNLLQITVAVMLNLTASRRYKKITQTFMFLPYFISAVLIGFLVFNLLNYDYGFVNGVLRSIGSEKVSFYSKPNIWPFVIVMAHLWQSTGYGSIVYFATIMGVDSEIVEASKIDGANLVQEIRYILLPSLKPTAIILVLFSIGGIMRGNFGLFYNIIGSANATLQPMTDIIETYTYRTMINQFNFSYSAAAGLYQSIIGFIIVNVANGIVRKVEPEYALF